MPLFEDANQLASNCTNTMHKGTEPVHMFQIPFQELVTGRSVVLYSSDTQHLSLPLQENWQVHPSHFWDQFFVGIWPHVSPHWPGFHEIINKRSQTAMSNS